MPKPIHQILNECEMKATEQEKISVLRANDHYVLRAVLGHAFDPRIQFDLPKGPLPDDFKFSEFDEPFRLYQEARKFYIFVKGVGPAMPATKRQGLYLDLLQSLPRNEGMVVAAMVNKSLPYKTITPELVQKAFPGIF